MSNSSYVYASGRVSGLEESLLSKRVWNQLLTADDKDEVLRILGETWYGTLLQVEKESGFEAALKGAVSLAEEELLELSDEQVFRDGILLRRDVRNARYIWKSFASGNDGEVEIEAAGLIPTDVLKRVWGDVLEVDSLPGLFKEALEEIQALHSPAAVELDKVLDKLAAKVESNNLGQMTQPVCTIPKVKIELRNFLIASRNRSEELSPVVMQSMLFSGGYHKTFEVVEALRTNKLPQLLQETSGFELAATALEAGLESGSFLAFQRESDSMLLDILEKAKSQMFSSGPLAAYVLARELETSHLKLIVAGKAAGIDTSRLTTRIPRG